MRTKEEIARALQNSSYLKESIMTFFVTCDLCGRDADWHISLGLDHEFNLCYLCMKAIEEHIQSPTQYQRV